MSICRIRTVDPGPVEVWTPWWYRPSSFLAAVILPALLIFAFSDYSLTLSKARLFFGHREIVVGVGFLLFLAFWSRVGESDKFRDLMVSISTRLKHRTYRQAKELQSNSRISEQFFHERFDWFLMAVFIVSHLIFFRNFLTNPGLIAGVLGGNLELKHTFKTIPGVTTWTQVTMLLAAVRGMRWAGLLPGKIRLFSLFHLVLFGTLFVRSVLWSERLALIEALIPFTIFALPKLCELWGKTARIAAQFLPLAAPILILGLFTGFEFLRSWQSYSGEHSGILQFGWKRLFTYYFEAMNTGAALLQASGFYSGMTPPTTENQFGFLYDSLYKTKILDIEFNNPSGIWYFCMRLGNLLTAPALILLGIYMGWTWRRFREGRLFSLIFPINFMLTLEIIRIYYWPLSNRVIPSTLIFVLILIWSATVAGRLRELPAPDAKNQ